MFNQIVMIFRQTTKTAKLFGFSAVVVLFLSACGQVDPEQEIAILPTTTPPPTALPTQAVVPTDEPTTEPTAEPSPVLPTPVPPTATAVPTELPTETATQLPSPTETTQLTETPLPTNTPMPTDTPEPSPTNTPEPSATPQPTESAGALLTEFADSAEIAPWFIVNDTVMGGVSTAQLDWQEGALQFSGNLSLDNNGGFTSFRSNFAGTLEEFTGLRIRLRGDGRSYFLRVRDFNNGREVAHEVQFSTVADQWIVIEAPFEWFIPTFRGFPIDHPPLDTSNVTGFGFMLREKDEGRFNLEIDWIAAYR